MTQPTQSPYHQVDHFVGNTPLIYLKTLSELTGSTILGKAEFMNPGGSVKDRAAIGIILDAEKRGQLKPGMTIVEGTAGNTGIGLTVIGQARGYKTVIIIPNTQSPEKMELLRNLGAEVIPVPAKPYKDPDNYIHIAHRKADENGWFWANQFDNVANRDAHEQTTGPEIHRQTNGEVTAFVAAIGSGGTLGGVSLALKKLNPKVKAVCADPCGAAMWNWFNQGVTEASEGDSVAEGIGQSRVTANVADIPVDHAYKIDDQTALTIIKHLARDEGIFLGLSSGINVGGAVRQALEHGPGQVITTILCDTGVKYQSKLYNPEWLAEQGLSDDLPIESILDA
ncbi:MAG: cysteine synthase A [Verrucomicrobia bacterium]|nr:cysteine synthase A [Verrucomicrobiota bacterium]MCH8512671.1 cysteine synthase A [Kiritimatiellia bacterium]